MADDFIPARIEVLVLDGADDGWLDEVQVSQHPVVQRAHDVAERRLRCLIAHAHEAPHRREAYAHALCAYFVDHGSDHFQ
ncbi:hypothetical protein D3C76_859200 [compost metagenome]